MLIRLVKASVGKFEHDASSQYRFHLLAAWFWFITMFIVPFLISPGGGDEWVSLVILEVSLYANFATEFGAMSAALGAEQRQQQQQPFSNPNYAMASQGLGWGDQDNEPLIHG